MEFRVERDAERVRLRTSAMVVSLWLHPFRLDVHRPDGSVVIETAAADQDGQYWPYATLNDAFTLRRRCRHEDAIYGLGEKTGRQNRKGRDFIMYNADVLNPDAAAEFIAGKAADDPRGDPTSVEYDPYYVSIPFFYHQDYPDGRMAASFVDGYRGSYEFSQSSEYRISFRGGQYTEYVFAGPHMPEILNAYTWLTGRIAPPPLWSLGYHQCRWFHYTQQAVEALADQHRQHQIPCDGLWLDIEYMDGYRVFTWNPDLFPDPRRCSNASRNRDSGLSRSSIPASSTTLATRSSTPAWSATSSAVPKVATSTSDRSGRVTPPSPTSPPRRRANGGVI